jgi:hypothetical protein
MTVRRIFGAVLVAALLGPAATAAIAARVVPRPTALYWAGRYFVDRDAFAHWLAARHGNFNTWAQRHPDGRQTLESATAVPAPLTSLGGPKSGPTAEAAPAGADLVTHSTAAASATSGLEVALAAIGLLLLALSLAPAQILAGRFRWAAGLAHQRWLLGGAAASILVTLALARSLG